MVTAKPHIRPPKMTGVALSYKRISDACKIQAYAKYT
jgi:hypothetical protein